MKKIVLLAFVLLLLLPTVFGICFSPVAANPETKLFVDPPISTASLGESFIVNITVADVKNLYTYQFRLSWEPEVLNVTRVTEGPFLSSEGNYTTYFSRKIFNDPDPLGFSGYIYVACTLMGEPRTAAASGSGILTTVEFFVKGQGNTSLYLYDTMLLDGYQDEMPHTTDDGYVIPEFATLTSMLLILIVLTVAIVIYKRRLLKTPIH